MASICSPGAPTETSNLVENREKPSASKKRCDIITTIVLMVLLAVSMSLSAYFTIHPFGPTIPNTTLSIPLLGSLGGTLGFAIGSIVQFVRCVETHKLLENRDLSLRLEAIEARLEQERLV